MTDSNDQALATLAAKVIAGASRKQAMLTVAESCTGGMVAAALTDISGASTVLDRGFVTYSNAAKSDLLGVAEATLAAHGAVSRETAAEMASGALAAAPLCHIAVAVTGIAGPGGGSAEKPVGLVWFGLAVRGGEVVTSRCQFDGDRTAIRTSAAKTAMNLFLDGLGA
ncbi:MAG: CinA family protein [Candidatus Puniceispirillaceae bacterium]